MALLKCKICGEEFEVSGNISSVNCGKCGAKQTVINNHGGAVGSVNYSNTAEKRYDVFLSCREYDENGDKTVDSIIARNIFNSLTEKGLTVYFSGDDIKEEKEKENTDSVYRILNSSKVMLLLCTKKEYFYEQR